jgi:Ca2+-binding EF-hand superfamily protein
VKLGIVALALVSTSAMAQQMQQMQMPDPETLFFQQYDTDQNGTVSKAEFLKPSEAQFAYMDKNADGVLDKAEVKAFSDEMQQRMREMQQRMQQSGGQYPGMPGR